MRSAAAAAGTRSRPSPAPEAAGNLRMDSMCFQKLGMMHLQTLLQKTAIKIIVLGHSMMMHLEQTPFQKIQCQMMILLRVMALAEVMILSRVPAAMAKHRMMLLPHLTIRFLDQCRFSAATIQP
ncbi:unnamed protein product [Heterosigma akashiwo]